MQIFAKLLDGTTGTLEVERYDTVASIKQKLIDKYEYPICRQRIIFRGSQLFDDSRSLKYWGITMESTLKIYFRFGSCRDDCPNHSVIYRQGEIVKLDKSHWGYPIEKYGIKVYK